MGVLRPVSLRHRLCDRAAVLRRAEEGGDSADRARACRIDHGPRHCIGGRLAIRLRSGHGCGRGVGRPHPVGAARDGAGNHRRVARRRRDQGGVVVARPACRRGYLRVRRHRRHPLCRGRCTFAPSGERPGSRAGAGNRARRQGAADRTTIGVSPLRLPFVPAGPARVRRFHRQRTRVRVQRRPHLCRADPARRHVHRRCHRRDASCGR